jgi:hypothetical protein
MRPDNPVRGVERFADGQRQRRLADAEYAAFGSALRKAERDKLVWPPAIALSRFLLVTGWRRGEAIGLRGSDLDLPRRTATLGETKTGRSVRPLSTAAVKLLRSAATKPDALVFPASRRTGLMTGYPKFWRRILKPAELSADVTPQTLRHSFASLAADMGYSEPTIAALIGHAGRAMTSRYVHSADAVLPPHGRLAFGDIVHEAFDIGPGHARHGHGAEQRLDMPLDPPAIGGDRGCRLGSLPARQDASSLGVVEVAELSNARGLALGLLKGRRIETAGHAAEQPLCLAPRGVGRPGRAVAADGVPPLPPFRRPVEQHIGNRIHLPARTEAGNCAIPDHLSGLQCRDLALADLSCRNHALPRPMEIASV